MPRFSWSAVPADLAAVLARELALDEAPSPAAALRATFGATPGTDFVRISWPVLLDVWLGGDADARVDLVARLRAAGLGDSERAPRTRAAQLGYLRTCRNTGRMRPIVLERFLELGRAGAGTAGGRAGNGSKAEGSGNAGEQQPYEEAPVPRPGAELRAAVLGRTDATANLRAKVEAAWRDLERALAEALPVLPLGAHMVLTLDPTAGGTGDARYFVEVAVPDEGVLHAEAVGNAYLPAGDRLDRSAIADLVALGWSPPGVVEGTEGNFGLLAPTAEGPRVAGIVVHTLREVYGAPHPAFLTYAAQGLDGEVALSGLGGVARPAALGAGDSGQGSPEQGGPERAGRAQGAPGQGAAGSSGGPDTLDIQPDPVAALDRAAGRLAAAGRRAAAKSPPEGAGDHDLPALPPAADAGRAVDGSYDATPAYGVASVPSAGESPGTLAEQVKEVVAGLLQTSPESLHYDQDGDIGIRSGSAMVFVRVLDDPPLVDVYSPVLTHVRPTERLYEKLSTLTRRMPLGRLYVDDDTVWASLAVFGRDFQPSHLTLAIRVMTGLADALDDRLQGDFGGTVFFGDTLPGRREAAAESSAAGQADGAERRSGERTGMYL